MREIDVVQQDLKSIWRRLVALLGERAAPFAAELLLLLRDLDSDPARDAAAEVRALVASYANADETISRRVAALLERTRSLRAERAPDEGDPRDIGGDEGEAVPVESPSPRHVSVPVWYATDRNHQPGQPASRRYGIDRSAHEAGESPLAYGLAAVSIPDGHRKGRMESPKWYKLQFRENPDLHIMVESVDELGHSSWLESLRTAGGAGAALDATDTSDDILVFVHGYRTGWADAIKRAAQFSYDLEFDGRTVAYTWPSQGKLLSYTVDENNAAWAGPHFSQLLRDLLENSGARRVHLVAHSMGNRIMSAAIHDLADALAGFPTHLGNVIFAAPDVDADTFRELITAFQAVDAVEEHPRPRLTLYSCGADAALDLSRRIHKLRRAGDARDGIVVVPPMDTIEVTQIVLDDPTDDRTGHAYFCSNRHVIADLNSVVLRGAAPPRFGLEPADGGRYWRL
ncbi:alpha/beta hydrolase [Microbacterium sp. B2969]|uniref:Alpha/beta hydrolase n=1 Tax=Microbacterium alkaliflavum TaxID=3248839 RepID=A0ABW7Q6R3_9MICO